MNKNPAHLTVAALVILFLVLTISSTAIVTGCRTINSTNQVDIATISAAIKGVARSATLYAVRKEPKSTNYLQLFSVYGNSFSTNASLDPDSLNRFVQSLPFKQTSTPEAQLAISTILTAYEIYWVRHPMAPIDRNKEFVKYIDALTVGVALGLSDAHP